MANYNSLKDEAKDIYLRKFIVVVKGEVNRENVDKITAELKYLDSIANKNQSITIMINSHGGSVQDGWSFINEMDRIKEKRILKTHCDGMAMSMGLNILTNGTKGYRTSFYLASLMAHYASGSIPYGTHKDHNDWLKYSKDTHDLLIQYYYERTGNSIEQLEKDFDKDWFLTPNEAKEYGFIDEVIKYKEYQPPKIDKRKKYTHDEWKSLTDSQKNDI